jgi:hypothetical protein
MVGVMFSGNFGGDCLQEAEEEENDQDSDFGEEVVAEDSEGQLYENYEMEG